MSVDSGHVWATATNRAGSYLDMQADGNLVVYAPRSGGRDAVWSGRDARRYALPPPRGSVNVPLLSAPHHSGRVAVDVVVPAGTTLYATTAGTITTWEQDGGCGWAIQINGDDGAKYVYCHASRRDVAGGRVSVGQEIGRSGGIRKAQGAGNSEGPHLHLQIEVGGVSRCPQSMLVALYNDTTGPSPGSLPKGGCTK